jgi:hypothetical protein
MNFVFLYIVQALSIWAAFVFAWKDVPAVRKFHNDGASPEEMAGFHRNGWVIKVFFCILAGLVFKDNYLFGGFSFILSGLWIWLLFDPVLNVSRDQGFTWDYLGLNDADGRRWRKWFGDKKAGKWKAVVLSAAILILNLLIYFL